MDLFKYVENIDERMNRINKNYKYIYDNIHNYLNNECIEYEHLLDFELALQNLSIELNKLVYLFNQQELNENNSIDNTINQFKYNNNENIDKIDKIYKMDKIDYILDKTIFHYMPLLFLYFMIFDKESILHIKDFIENKNECTNKNIQKNTNDFVYIIEPIDE
jgi:hypothetical protein